jgi:hypothetical protein
VDKKQFCLFLIKSLLSTLFLFSPTHFTFSIMLGHFSCSITNSRCEKVEMGEGWLGRVAGRWAKRQKFMDQVIFG